MAALRDESKLYKTLDDMYINRKTNNISEEFYNECIDVALKFSKREIQFALFQLGLLDEDIDSGIEVANNISNSLRKVLDAFTGKNVKRTLIINVLQIALDEK